MDGPRFDRLAQGFASGQTRRHTLGGLITGAVVLLGLGSTETAGKKRRGTVTAEGPCGDGTIKANRCKRDGQCCTGVCDKQKGKQPYGRCRCRKLNQSCTEDRNCCATAGQPMSCVAGTCQTTESCVPDDGACGAGAECCAGLECKSGTCQSTSTCGPRGEVCVPGQECVGDACACTLVSCPAAEHGDVRCIGDTCRVQCDSGWMNCDGDPATGCESPSGTAQNCAGCGDACGGATPFCAGRQCVACRDDADCGALEACVNSDCQA